MKTKYHSFSTLLFLLLITACNSSSVQTNEASEVMNKTDNSKKEGESDSDKTLLIEGTNIWVRSEPTTGEVVMKLNNGDKCLVLTEGPHEEIRGFDDIWYQIVFEGDTGWVFGSQTSIKMPGSEKTKIFLEAMQKFVYYIASQDYESLNKTFIQAEDSVYFIGSGPGVYPIVKKFSHFSDHPEKGYNIGYLALEGEINPNEPFTFSFGYPEDICDPESNPGLFYQINNEYSEVSGIKRGLYTHMLMEEIPDDVEIQIQDIEKEEEKVSYELTISWLFPAIDFYFYIEEGKCYLFSFRENDCSA